MKRLLLCATALLLGFASLSAQTEFDRMKDFLRNLATYNNRFTREQVYLHLDNNGYFEGETIWLNANVVFAGNLRPSNMSHVLYVELLNSAGDLMQRKRLYIKEGTAAGEFKLDETIHSGYYEIRAYTRAMLNWDAAAVFSRVIPVFAKPATPGDFSKLDCDDAFYRDGHRPKTEAFQVGNAQKGEGLNLSFFPEGGNRVKGLPASIAFKLTDKKGFALTDTLRVCNVAGETLCIAPTEHQGMGSFTLPATADKDCYVLVGNNRKHFALPEMQEDGCMLNVQPADSDSLQIRVMRSSRFPNELLGLSVECRGRTCYFDTLRLADRQTMQKTISRKILGQGVNQITLFRSTGDVVAERRVWGDAAEPLRLTIQQNAARYQPFQPIVLNVSLTDKEQKPRSAKFSLSVREQGGELVARVPGIRENLLMSSDLKGYISRPDYYFESSDARHRRALDLLLQVQGWRRYDWQEMAGVTPFQLTQPVETGMLLDGKLLSARKKGLANYDMDVTIILPGLSPLRGKAKTDSLGNFAFKAPSFFGEGMGVFQASKDGKNKYSLVALNRRFSPKPRGIYSQEIALRPPVFGEKANLMESPVFQWQDTIKTDIVLGGVSVKAKGYDDYFAGRYSWGGGERRGKLYSNIYYNTNEELEAYMDAGEDVPGIWEWLAEKDKNFQYEYGDVEDWNIRQQYRMKNVVIVSGNGVDTSDAALTRRLPVDFFKTYKGKHVLLVLDNELKQDNTDEVSDALLASNQARMPVSLDEVKSIMIAEDPMVARELSVRATGGSLPDDLVTIFLYSDPMINTFEHKKGQRVTQIHGYASAQDFFAPDYRKSTMPNPEDFRRTLYWVPDLETDKDGKASVTLYSNARKYQRICISAQGITTDGNFIDLEQ